jgi:hypothetical protein
MSQEGMDQNLGQERVAKHKILSFEYRNTGAGGKDDTILISLRTGEIIYSRLHLTRSGSHGKRQYRLVPAKYLLYNVSRSNAGNVYITLKVILVNENGEVVPLNQWKMYEGKEQITQLGELPKKIEEILVKNKYQLPLFHYIYVFDHFFLSFS